MHILIMHKKRVIYTIKHKKEISMSPKTTLVHANNLLILSVENKIKL